MSYNKFMRPTTNKFGRVPPRPEIIPPIVADPESGLKDFTASYVDEDFNTYINNAVPIWDVLKMTEEEYNNIYNPTPPPVVEELPPEEELTPPPPVEEEVVEEGVEEKKEE